MSKFVAFVATFLKTVNNIFIKIVPVLKESIYTQIRFFVQMRRDAARYFIKNTFEKSIILNLEPSKNLKYQIQFFNWELRKLLRANFTLA